MILPSDTLQPRKLLMETLFTMHREGEIIWGGYFAINADHDAIVITGSLYGHARSGGGLQGVAFRGFTKFVLVV